MGSPFPGRISERFNDLHELLYRRSALAWWVLYVRSSSSDIKCRTENSIDGSKPGPLGITPDQMTDEIWEYVFCNGPFPSPSPLPREKADALKHAFEYFYPFDLRSSAKELIPKHLTFATYNHAAIFPADKFPLSMRTNGHLMLNGKKMSKSTGNPLTLKEAIGKFGADATRLSLADAGDGMEDANFEEKTANANILRCIRCWGGARMW